MLRESEKQFNSSLKNCKMIETYGKLNFISYYIFFKAYIAKVYRRLDQPLSAIEQLQKGISEFPKDTTLLTALARIFEVVY